MPARVALVFRSVDERTAEAALRLARDAIDPDEDYILSGCRPFRETVQRMLALPISADQIVSVDADCLILESLRPFLDLNREPYVDCFVMDRFRGRLHCGVHINRRDVFEAMARIGPDPDDPGEALRPESRLRRRALNALGYAKAFRNFAILHDHGQWLRDVWAKYALRELRSRTPEQRRQLDAASRGWASSEEPDLRVAWAAMTWARQHAPADMPTAELRGLVDRLPELSGPAFAALGLDERPPLSRDELSALQRAGRAAHQRWDGGPVFGLGLSRTGTKSLTTALHILGVDTVHYPVSADSFRALSSGSLDFQLMEAFDGITDITTVPFFRELDARYPDARFVLTVRDSFSWLASCERHYRGRGAFPETTSPKTMSPGQEEHMRIRRLLRAAVYGIYDFRPERFVHVYEQHVAAVRKHFAGRPGKLLELDIAGGEGWEKLAPFLGRPTPAQPFPHVGSKAPAARQPGDD